MSWLIRALAARAAGSRPPGIAIVEPRPVGRFEAAAAGDEASPAHEEVSRSAAGAATASPPPASEAPMPAEMSEAHPAPVDSPSRQRPREPARRPRPRLDRPTLPGAALEPSKALAIRGVAPAGEARSPPAAGAVAGHAEAAPAGPPPSGFGEAARRAEASPGATPAALDPHRHAKAQGPSPAAKRGAAIVDRVAEPAAAGAFGTPSPQGRAITAAPAAPPVTVSIGRIEVAVELPRQAAAAEPAARSRGFAGYEAIRRGRR